MIKTIAIVLLSCLAPAACLQATQAAAHAQAYSTVIDRCRETSSSCQDFIACQHAAQVDAGYPLTGTCSAGGDQ